MHEVYRTLRRNCSEGQHGQYLSAKMENMDMIGSGTINPGRVRA
jgi:hypothetical protein